MAVAPPQPTGEPVTDNNNSEGPKAPGGKCTVRLTPYGVTIQVHHPRLLCVPAQEAIKLEDELQRAVEHVLAKHWRSGKESHMNRHIRPKRDPR